MLPPGLTLFLEEGTAAEWHDACSSSTPMPMDSLWPAPSKSHPTYMGGAWPKIPAKPSAGWPQLSTWLRPKEGPDPVNYHHRWISVEMSRHGTHHPHWWKEIRASRKAFRGILKEGHNNYHVNILGNDRQQPSGCQPCSRRPLDGRMPCPGLVALPPKFMPINDTSSPKHFQVVRQEKTLALAQVLHVCAKDSGV